MKCKQSWIFESFSESAADGTADDSKTKERSLKDSCFLGSSGIGSGRGIGSGLAV